MSEKRIPVGAGWKKSTSKGEVINISINIDGKDVRFNMWTNKYKEPGDNKPDYRIFEDTYQKPEPF